jgi:TPR repeat protein
MRNALVILVAMVGCGKHDVTPASGSAAAGSAAAKVEPAPPVAPDAAMAAGDPLAALPPVVESCTGKECTVAGAKLGDADPLHAMSLFKKGCDDGEPIGCAMLGTGFAKGAGVAKNPLAAAKLYDRSCTLGYVKGCYNLALMLANGDGIPTDMPRAIQLLDKACTGEAWKACGSLGDYYLNQGDKAKAMPLLERGCQNKDTTACEALAKAK